MAVARVQTEAELNLLTLKLTSIDRAQVVSVIEKVKPVPVDSRKISVSNVVFPKRIAQQSKRD